MGFFEENLCDFVSGDVSQPAFLAIVNDIRRHFYGFIQAEDEINPHGGKLQHKGGQQPGRHHDNPHADNIQKEAEFRIASGPEDTTHPAGVHRWPPDIDNADDYHDPQITLGLGGQRGHGGGNDGIGDQNHQTADEGSQEGQS